jgi:hypothetical protein
MRPAVLFPVIHQSRQIKFYKVMAVSTGLYGSKNWVLTEKDKNRIQAAEMRFLRAMLGVTRQDGSTIEAIC